MQNFYKKQHALFEQSTMRINESFTPPVGDNSWAEWKFHMGGIEGIHQKKWTLITQCGIMKVLNEMNLSGKLTGSGDNQFILLDLRNVPEEAREELVRQFIARLNFEFNQVGLDLKIDETWYSPHLLCYGKVFYYKGIPVSSSLKKVVRTFYGSNDSLESFNSVLGGITTSGQSICNVDSVSLLGYYIYLMEAMIYISFSAFSAFYLSMSREQRVILLTHGLDSGGLNVSNVLQFLYRGCPDQLTQTLCWSKWLWDKHPVYRNAITACFHQKQGKMSEQKLLELINQPYSLNFVSPRSSESIIKEQLKHVLGNPLNVKNKRLLELFTLFDEES
jgi:hypothetical protein